MGRARGWAASGQASWRACLCVHDRLRVPALAGPAGCLAECLPGGRGQRGGTALDSLGKEHCPSHLSPTGQPASAASPDFLCAHRGPVLRLPVEECSRRGPSRPRSARAWHGLRSAGTLLRISRFPGQTQLHLPSKSSLLLLLPAPPR